MADTKENFIDQFKAARAALLQTLAGLDEAEASATTGPTGTWPSIKAIIGHISAWEREILVADEMLKRGEESYLHKLVEQIDTFNQTQTAHRQSWTLAQLRTELDLNYEALLMAWDDYEDENGPFGPATWLPDQPDSLYWLINHQLEHGREIAQRRNLVVDFPTDNH
jgi:hypothetical protein